MNYSNILLSDTEKEVDWYQKKIQEIRYIERIQDFSRIVRLLKKIH